MRVYLDDERKMPDDFDVLVKTAEAAIELLKTGNVTVISLDHDLGTQKTGYDVAKFIEESAYNRSLKKIRVYVHSQNVVGKKNIKICLQNACRYWMSNVTI